MDNNLELRERLITSRVKEREAELLLLQSQINPHFLYNTLDSIQALAMMGESKKVCDLVEALGGFYRKSVSGGRDMLTIEEEFQIAKDYADIMRIRFEDKAVFPESLLRNEVSEIPRCSAIFLFLIPDNSMMLFSLFRSIS